MEIDVLARHKINNSLVLVECKAWNTALPADVVTKLLGNVVFKDADEGWLITTGPLSKDAKGLQEEWEQGKSTRRNKLSFYTANRVIELLLDTKMIRDSENLDLSLQDGYILDEMRLLLLTDIGNYWIVVAFEAKTGQRVTDKVILEEIKARKNMFSEYNWFSEKQSNSKAEEVLLAEYNSVVPIITGDTWNDYRPARPEDFVGRKKVIKEIFDYFDMVINGQTETRLFAVKAPSGMGKSSLLSKVTAMANGGKKRICVQKWV